MLYIAQRGSSMLSLKDYKNAKDIKNLVAKLFESRQVAHNVHLQTKSYAQHKALNGFYENILYFTDTFVETYQGQYGILSGYEKLIIIEPVNEIEKKSKIFFMKFGDRFVLFFETILNNVTINNCS